MMKLLENDLKDVAHLLPPSVAAACRTDAPDLVS